MLKRVIFVVFFSSCVDFNTCEVKSGPFIAESVMDFDIRRSTVRTRSCPIGHFVTDAMYWHSQRECKKNKSASCPDFALINAGAIRQETACGTRKSIPAGALHLSDIVQLLRFPNDLVVVRLSGNDIKIALEHAVSSLGRSSADGPSSHFLHVSGLTFDVDCKNPPLALSADGLSIARMGSRVSNIQLTSKRANKPLYPSHHYRVVTTNYIAQGNDGFIAFLQRDQNNTVIFETKRVDVKRSGDQALTKYNPKTDTILNENAQPIPYRQAVIDWMISQNEKNNLIASDTAERIKIDPNCYGSI